MAKTGYRPRSKKVEVDTTAYKKWMELEHIVEGMANAMHSAYHPHVAATGQITENMQQHLIMFTGWCQRFYGQGKKD